MLASFLERLAFVPNAPFLYLPMARAVGGILRELKGGVSLATDAWALYARYSRGEASRRLLIVSHLDHPAIVVGRNNWGVAFGSVGASRITRSLEEGVPPPLRIFSPEGDFLGKATLSEFSYPRARVTADFAIPPNSHALWGVSPFEREGDVVRMYSADNTAVTAVALASLARIVASGLWDTDITTVFTFVEEVHQLSATAIARSGRTPFFALSKDDIIINLEAMEVGIPPGLVGLADELGVDVPAYDGGVLIKVNGGSVVYGSSFPAEPNLAEALLLESARGRKHQHSLGRGSTDARSFSLEATTPSIATLTAPCRYKHNIGDKGEFVAEEVSFSDLETMRDILTRAMSSYQESAFSSGMLSLSSELKKRRPFSARVSRDRAFRRKLALSARPRLRAGRYFPETLEERLSFDAYRVLAKALYPRAGARVSH